MREGIRMVRPMEHGRPEWLPIRGPLLFHQQSQSPLVSLPKLQGVCVVLSRFSVDEQRLAVLDICLGNAGHLSGQCWIFVWAMLDICLGNQRLSGTSGSNTGHFYGNPW